MVWGCYNIDARVLDAGVGGGVGGSMVGLRVVLVSCRLVGS